MVAKLANRRSLHFTPLCSVSVEMTILLLMDRVVADRMNCGFLALLGLTKETPAASVESCGQIGKPQISPLHSALLRFGRDDNFVADQTVLVLSRLPRTDVR